MSIQKEIDLGLVAASSRFNYGDVLYSYIGEKIFPVSAHLNLSGRRCGSLENPVYALRDVRARRAIYLGGELFPKRYSSLWRSESLLRFGLERAKDRLRRRPVPSGMFVAAGRSCSIGVGMQRLALEDALDVEVLRNFAYLGVRDTASYKAARALGLDPVITPDLAFITPQIFPRTKDKKNSAVFHFNKAFLTRNFEGAVGIVNHYVERLGCSPVIQNMAECYGHDSNRVARRLAESVGAAFHSAGSVESITSTLAQASYYIGNSYHGGIVSMSYGGAVVWLGAHGNKIANLASDMGVPYIDKSDGDLPDPVSVSTGRYNSQLEKAISTIKEMLVE